MLEPYLYNSYYQCWVGITNTLGCASLFSRLAILEVLPCFSYVAPCYSCALRLMPSCFRALFFSCLAPCYTSLSCLAFVASCLAAFVPCYTSLSRLALLALCLVALTFAPCCSTLNS